jgi:O-antigen biosynthesis protein
MKPAKRTSLRQLAGDVHVWLRDVEDELRGRIWRGSAPLRKLEPVHAFLTWLANSTKRPRPGAPKPPKPKKFTLPDAASTLRKLEQARLVLPPSADPDVSIVIPVYNNFAFTYACLEAIAADDDAPSYEVIVVDDCSSDATQTMLAAVDGVRVVKNERQLGFIGACNAGAAVARGRFLVFLNNDTEPRRGWLRELHDTFDREPRAGLVGSKLVYPDGRLQEAGGIVWRNGAGWNVGRLGDPNDPRYSYARKVDYCSGASFMIRRALFESLDGFDTHFAPAYYEDTDLAFRVRRAGWEVWYQPLSEVVHIEGLSNGTSVATGIKQHQVVNEQKFAARWAPSLATHRPYGEQPELEQDRGCRGRVLVVDAATPRPDRDSGSLRIFNLMRLFRRLDWRVTFVASDHLWHAGEETRRLQRAGIEVVHHPYVTSLPHWLRRHLDDYDLVIFSRADVASRFLPAAAKQRKRARIVFDTVDLHFLREQRQAEVAGDARLVKRAQKRRAEELRLASLADCTLVVSPVEQSLIEAALPKARVRVVSNIHDVPGRKASFAERDGILFLGGYNHSPNVDAALWLVREIVPALQARLPGVTVQLVGSDPPDEIKRLAGKHVIVTGFVPDVAPYFERCRLSVSPLRYGAGVKGKINMSLSHGVPVVATSLAVEGMHLSPGRDVLVADDAAAFADAVARLYGDADAWEAMSQAGVTHTERHFSFAAAERAVREMFEALWPRRRAAAVDESRASF